MKNKLPKMCMLVGLPGAGKSTYCNTYKNYTVISSDEIRKEFGDVNDQSKNNEVFTILRQRVINNLNKGNNVLVDSTNLNRRRRIAFLNELKNIPCKKICVLVATPYEICVAQNFERHRKVPSEVLWNMYKSFNVPTHHEGFDDIVVYYLNEGWKEYYGDILTYVKSLRDFNQDNPHHTLTLGKHMFSAMDNVLKMNGKVYNDVAIAALCHDIGKLEVKEFKNSKGEPTKEAHYYNHHNISCYKSLFFRYPYEVNKMYVSLLIELHMKPHLEWEQSEKAKEKDRKLFGDQVIEEVMLIHQADVSAK